MPVGIVGVVCQLCKWHFHNPTLRPCLCIIEYAKPCLASVSSLHLFVNFSLSWLLASTHY